MDKRRALEARVEQLARQSAVIQEHLAILDSLPEDDFEDGAVFTFIKTFYPGGRRYTYAVIKYNGLWSTTGPASPKSITWDELMEFVSTGVDEVWWAVEFERII
jgi:hypothetical protein